MSLIRPQASVLSPLLFLPDFPLPTHFHPHTPSSLPSCCHLLFQKLPHIVPPSPPWRGSCIRVHASGSQALCVCVCARVPGTCGTCFFGLRVAVSHECLCHVLVSGWCVCVCVCVCRLPAEVHRDPWTLPYTGGTSEWRWWPLEDQSLSFILPFLQALLLLLLLLLSHFSRV